MTELWRLGAADIATRVANREISATEVTEQSLQRLQDVNPAINAVVQPMPEAALAAARAVDDAIADGHSTGILAGVPVTIKVNIDQQGFANTNGIRIQQDNFAGQDSPVVTNLRKAGAIIVGRTNTPAFSMRWFTRNSLHGHTLNPRNAKLTPGGSSGGSAAAVAAGICALGHGTDIAGSIRYPAYACGLHGIRPSLGRVPAVNLSLPDRHIGAQLTAVSGPIARSIADLRLGLAAMAAGSELDPWWVPAPLEQAPAPKRVALCISPDGLEVMPQVERALHEAARQLEDAGWQVAEVDSPPMRQAMELQLLLWMSEYQFSGGAAVRQEDDPDANFVYAQLCENCPIPTLESLMEALQQRITLAREWQLFLAQYPILLCPVSAEPPFPDMLDVESPESFRRVLEAQMTQIAVPLMGIPGISVATDGNTSVPMGVQLVASRFREDTLFAAATDIEARNAPLEIADPD
ncbi:MAG: amidase family protein [Gammaproteobacteria bacterium]|nr:amidase family protein [Gammaproteobacteria bacterium]MDH3859416.1 amidase family protein [Gammaproteobacteria bacterium]